MYSIQISQPTFNSMIEIIQWCYDHCDEKFYISPSSNFSATAFVYSRYIHHGWELLEQEWRVRANQAFTMWDTVWFLFEKEEDALLFRLRW